MESETNTAMPADAPAPSVDRNRYKSPPPPPPSMTPPPSSQAPQLVPPQARTPTPTHSHLSSPPPTIKPAPPQPNADLAHGLYTSDQIASATMEELRNMINETNAAYREARASAAHHSLQYNLLRFESSEVMNRMQVELEMTQKEVEVLQMTAHRSNNENPSAIPSGKRSPSNASPDQSLANLRNHCHLLEIENDRLQRRLADAKTVLVDREAAFTEENERLKDRIRKNREHMTLLRRSSVGQVPMSDVFSTPQQPRIGHERLAGTYTATPGTGRDKNFDALLLAASQEAATTPSTPTPKEPRTQRQGHTRGTHSLSSLPSTPQQNTKTSQRGHGPYYVELDTQHTPHTPRGRTINRGSSHLQRRRESRDSTISASDMDGGRDDSHSENEEDVPESQASQEAANLLRKSASFRQATAPNSAQSSYTTGPTKPKVSMMQAKLPSFPVKKADSSNSATKRKVRDDDYGVIESGNKKARHNEGVGLGIGWSGARA